MDDLKAFATHLGFWAGILLVLSSWAGGVSEVADDPRVLATQAVEANPAIRALERQINALEHGVQAAVKWSDPLFAVDYLNVPWDGWNLGDSPMSGLQFRLQQKLTLPGKNDIRAKLAQSELVVKNWQLSEKRNQLAAMVIQAYWSLTLLRQLKEISERHIVLVEQLLLAVRAKYQVGKAAQHDLLNLQLLQQKLKDELNDFEQQDRALTAAINAALHRQLRIALKTPAQIPLAIAEATVSDLLAQAEAKRPLLKEKLARASWRRLAADVADIERWPDITVWAAYRVRTAAGLDSGKDFISLGFSIPLPIDYTDQALAEQAKQLNLAQAAKEAYRAAREQLSSDLEASLSAWRRAVQKVTTYKQQLIPKARQTLAATIEAYRTDRADFVSLYQAQLQLLQFERLLQKAQARTLIEQSVVEALIGSQLE